MAYTTSISDGNLTVVGSSASETLASTQGDGEVRINSYEGNDQVTVGLYESGTIGMGSGTDTVIFDAGVSNVAVSLGDAADTFNGNTDDSVTVGGQGGADNFIVDAVSEESRYAGGRGIDTFQVTAAATDATLVGGSEDDVFTFGVAGTAADVFVNGQVGADQITINAILTGNNTIRGGSEGDTITITTDFDDTAVFGDAGADDLTDGDGDNTLNGGDGADTIDSGAGVDTIIGGGGADRIEITTAESGTTAGAIAFATVDEAGTNVLTATADNFEVVVGFTDADTIVLDDALFTGEAARNAFADAAAGVAAVDGLAYFVYGTYNAALGTFTTSATGADTLLYTDADVATSDFDATADYVVFDNAQLTGTDFTFA